jgi:crossover junction endodeoxyribonuclease RusA
MHFVLEGPFKPYVRMTQRGKWVKPQAREYLASKDRLAQQFQEQLAGNWSCVERGTPLRIEIAITHAGGFHNRDLDNEIKAILDAAQGVVFDDDRWVDLIVAARGLGEREQIAIQVHPLPE